MALFNIFKRPVPFHPPNHSKKLQAEPNRIKQPYLSVLIYKFHARHENPAFYMILGDHSIYVIDIQKKRCYGLETPKVEGLLEYRSAAR